MKKLQNEQFKPKTAQVVIRVSPDLRKFYEDIAKTERRRLSDTLRIALEDRARQIAEATA